MNQSLTPLINIANPAVQLSGCAVGNMLPVRPTTALIDAHLIMNVLNHLAARDFVEQRGEDAWLFSLSDYLQEALRQQRLQSLTLADDVRLVEPHLNLSALVRSAELDLTIELGRDLGNRLANRCLFELANCLLASMRPQFGGQWRMRIKLAEMPEAFTGFSLLVELESTDASQATVDRRAAQTTLDELSAETCAVGNVIWFQESPSRLRLECTVSAP